MKKFNVVWIMIDSVRRYHTQGDDRSRLCYMDEFAKEGVEFLNCVTSAPSTLMSVSATLTSLPSYYLGRNYKDFQFDTDYFNSLTSILKKNNFKTDRSFIMHPLVRQKLKQFDLVPKKLWPSGLSHKDWFCNDDINSMFHSVLKNEKKQKNKNPSFWFIDYNCRNDENISDIVKNTIESLDDAGYNKNNTILMVSSDHGYPDPRRGITAEKLKQKKMPHDVFMTDDNIMIPLIVRYPGCIPGTKINNTISTLDVMPTILDILDINIPESIKNSFHGLSLLPLINGSKDKKYEDRKIRTDARLIDQPGRLTAIRGEKYKYIFHHDNKLEEFVYIGNNDNELIEESIINSKDEAIQLELQKFRNEFKNTELNAVLSQNKYFAHKLTKNLKNKIKNKTKTRLLLTGFLNKELLKTVVSELVNKFDNLIIDAVIINSKTTSLAHDNIDSIIYLNFKNGEILNSNKKLEKLEKYNYLINISNSPGDLEKQAFKNLNTNLKFDKKINVSARKSTKTYNSSFVRKLNNLKDHFVILWKNREWYLEEPSMIFKEPLTILGLIFKKERRINGGWKTYKYIPRKLK